jgi:hypothetical protein
MSHLSFIFGEWVDFSSKTVVSLSEVFQQMKNSIQQMSALSQHFKVTT